MPEFKKWKSVSHLLYPPCCKRLNVACQQKKTCMDIFAHPCYLVWAICVPVQVCLFFPLRQPVSTHKVGCDWALTQDLLLCLHSGTWDKDPWRAPTSLCNMPLQSPSPPLTFDASCDWKAPSHLSVTPPPIPAPDCSISMAPAAPAPPRCSTSILMSLSQTSLQTYGSHVSVVTDPEPTP